MKDNRENLIKLIQLIKEISKQPGNEWFLSELKNKVFKDLIHQSTNIEVIESKINLIKEYLSIDINRVIDYSYFEEPTRESLFRDCIEMGRFEKGTASHKIDFGEFCRYAHLQGEEMVNYFFNKISNKDINVIEQFIHEKVNGYKPIKKPTEIHHIFYTHKLSAFKSISQLSKKSIDILWFLNDFRNELSHRNSFTISTEDSELASFEKFGFVGAHIDFTKLDSYQKNIFNRGKYIITKRNKDFDLIYNAIEGLKNEVIEQLNKMKKLPITSNNLGSTNPILQEFKNKLDHGLSG